MSDLAPATPVPATRCLRILWSADDTAFGARRVQIVFLCDRVGEWPGLPMQKQVRLPNRRFRLVLIKPSHYDDDGYVIRWWRAMIPSNSLAAVYGIAADCAERQVLGPGVAIDIEAIDETSTRVDLRGLIRRFRRHGRSGRPELPWPSAASTCPDASRCWTGARSISTRAGTWALRCSRARPRAGLTRFCGTRPRVGCSPCTISWPICRAWRAPRCRSSPSATLRARWD